MRGLEEEEEEDDGDDVTRKGCMVCWSTRFDASVEYIWDVMN